MNRRAADLPDIVEGLRVELARRSPAGLGRFAFRHTWEVPPHVKALDRALIAVADGRIKRLLVCMPPRHGKSTMISRCMPAWFLGRFPDRRVILAGYGDVFAARWGAAARDVLDVHGASLFGVRVSPGSSAASRWDLAGREGGLIAAGVGGAITGHGAHLAIIDDPHKDAAEAASALIRDRVHTWYRETLYTRLEPGASIVLVMTRWHLDDLAGRLLAAAESDEGEDWHVLKLAAIAEDGDPLGRRPGEALWPERYPVEELVRIRAEIGSAGWAALYQQHPVPAEGGLFHRAWFPLASRPPEKIEASVRYWDLAGTAARPGADPDWSVGLLMGVDETGTYWVLDVQRLRGSPAEVEARMRSTAERDGPDVPIVVEQEPGSAGAYLIDHVARDVLPGNRVRPDKPTGPKALRAGPVAAKAECGLVLIMRGPWVAAFLDEIETFPYGAHDDQVDALSGAYSILATTTVRRLRDTPKQPSLEEEMRRDLGLPAPGGNRRFFD